MSTYTHLQSEMHPWNRKTVLD